jgi:hypothetical protein
MAGLEMNSDNPHKPSRSVEANAGEDETVFDEFACDDTVRMPRPTLAPTPQDNVVQQSEKDSGSDPYNTG